MSQKYGTLPARTQLANTYTLVDPAAPSNFQREIYGSFRSPKFSTKPEEWENAARRNIPEPNFNYVFGSASSGDTCQHNIEAFKRYRLKPRMLVNATRRDLSTELFGGKMKLDNPVIIAPIGVQGILHKDGEEATARAAKNLALPMILSTAATRTIEEIAVANGEGSNRWYQLYWPRPQYDDITISLLNRAKQNGYKVLVVTLDTFMLAWRPNDLDKSYLPFVWGQGCQIGLSDPVFNKYYDEVMKNDPRTAGEKFAEAAEVLLRPGSVAGALKIAANSATIRKSQAWLDVLNSGTYREWKHLQLLRDNWDGPIVLKGIQTVEDARKAAEFGMDGIIVSNHGGRQLDGAVASLDALAEIGADAEVQASGITILFDSGVRVGSDIIKALALGAKAVVIGRPYAYGLAMGGQEGVEHVLKCLLADFDNMMGNMGKVSVKDLSRDDLKFVEKL
jgi:lactate 2-monooxygenase